MEKIAEKEARNRTKNDSYFLKYDYNPFTEKENTRYNHSRSRASTTASHSNLQPLTINAPGRVEVGLIDAVHNLTNNKFRRFNR
jgi:hypothetical protein